MAQIKKFYDYNANCAGEKDCAHGKKNIKVIFIKEIL